MCLLLLRFSRQCPLVLLVKVGRKHGKVLGSEESSMGGLLAVHSSEKNLNIWAELVGRRVALWRNSHDDGRTAFRRKLWCWFWEGYMIIIYCNVDFGYPISIFSRTDDNHGKIWLSWPSILTDKPINQPKSYLRGVNLRESASRRPSVCLAIPALSASLSSVTDTLTF